MATESQLTISPPKRSAMANDRAVFPLPVGPAITTSNGSGLTGVPIEEASIAQKNDRETNDDENENADGFSTKDAIASFFRRMLRHDHRASLYPRA